MSYEIIFNDMIDSLTMAEIKIYEYNIIVTIQTKSY